MVNWKKQNIRKSINQRLSCPPVLPSINQQLSCPPVLLSKNQNLMFYYYILFSLVILYQNKVMSM